MIFDIIFERVQNIENKIQVSIAKYTKKGMKGVAESFDEYMKDAEGNLIQEDHPEKSYLIKSPDNYFIMKGKVRVWFKWKEGDPFQAEHVASWNEEGNKEHPGFETLINEKVTSDTVSATYEASHTTGSDFESPLAKWHPKVSEAGVEILEDNTVLVCPMQYQRGWSFSRAVLLDGESLDIFKEGTDCYIVAGEELTVDETKKIESLKEKKITSTKITVVNNSGTFCVIAKMFK